MKVLRKESSLKASCLRVSDDLQFSSAEELFRLSTRNIAREDFGINNRCLLMLFRYHGNIGGKEAYHVKERKECGSS